MRALPLSCLIALLTACAAPVAFVEDGWGVQRRDGNAPVLMSISEINAGTPPTAGEIHALPVRSLARGRHRITVQADEGIATEWTTGAVLFDAELERALAWLAGLAAEEPRALELRLTLMPPQGARRLERRHAADATLVIDLLVPVPAQPRSRGAVLEGALATGLHEAAHVLHPNPLHDRDGDEYRASLVAACYRISGMQAGDELDLAPGASVATRRDFTRAHSRDAALRVKRELAEWLGATRLHGRDPAGRARLQGFCRARTVGPGG